MNRMMNSRLSYESFFQLAFAISPFPFYLPQYFSMLQQLALSDESDDCSAVLVTMPVAATRETLGGDHFNYLRKRNPLEQQAAGIVATTSSAPAPAPSSTGVADWMVHGTPSKSFEDGAKYPTKLTTGLSRATVLLLLSAHLLRLLYFHGVVLILFDEPESAKPKAEFRNSSHNEASTIQWDLLGQSISMIVMQLLLLHTMMLLRRKQLSRDTKRIGNDESIAQNRSFDSFTSYSPTAAMDSRISGTLNAPTSLECNTHGYNHRNTSPRNSTPQHSSQYHRQWYRITTNHLHQLLSPQNILQSHSFLEYCELLMLVSVTVKLVFDYHWFPRHGKQVVEGLKHMSIILESCLALPQAIRNYRKGTTEGLSMVMVGGWVAGDFFKLIYFLINMIRGGDGKNSSNSNNNNLVFIWGCLFSLALDSTVGIQVAKTKPEMLEWQKRIRRSYWHWKMNKDHEDAGQQKARTICFQFLISFYRWARGK